jgi:hypothetical protein
MLSCQIAAIVSRSFEVQGSRVFSAFKRGLRFEYERQTLQIQMATMILRPQQYTGIHGSFHDSVGCTGTLLSKI